MTSFKVPWAIADLAGFFLICGIVSDALDISDGGTSLFKGALFGISGAVRLYLAFSLLACRPLEGT